MAYSCGNSMLYNNTRKPVKFLWEITKIFKGNRIITIKPTFKCNMKCYYCAVTNASEYYKVDYDTPPPYDELPPEYWIKLIKRIKPDVINFSGGEPGLYKGLAEIVNYAVKQRCLVSISSNLTVLSEFYKIYPTWRVYFFHTVHPGANLIGYHKMRQFFHVSLRTLSPLPLKKHEDQLVSWGLPDFNLIYSPDGSLYDSCDGASLKSNVIVTHNIKL